MEVFDLIIIGGGPGGYFAGERAGAAGLKTAVIEKREVGGTCLNEGCIPSKTFLNSGKIYEQAIHSETYGVTISNAQIDQKAVVARKKRVVKTLVSGVKSTLRKNKVKLITGEGIICGRNEEGFLVRVGDGQYTGKKLLIATGSEVFIPQIPGVREALQAGNALTSREILDLEKIPETMTIIGGGVIGLEMASYFQTAGCQVTIIEMLDKVAGPVEREISSILQKELEGKGIRFFLNSRVLEVAESTVVFKKDGEKQLIDAEKILLCVGRRACVKNLGLENVDVQTEKGHIVTDKHLRTNVSGIYACGDVNGKVMLAHTAYREAEVAVNDMVGKKDIMRYHAIPSVIYGHPEAASIGETMDSAIKKGIAAKEIRVPLMYSGRYIAEEENGSGLFKLVVDQKYQRIVGAHMIGSYCSEIIYGLASMIETEMRISEIKEIVFPHPSVSEIIREALLMLNE